MKKMALFVLALSNPIVERRHKFLELSRPHSVSITEFGAVGDGKTLNTVAFQNAIFYLKSFADKGGAELFVPAGDWLTGSFSLTSHLTLFLEKGARILGSQDFNDWEIVESLPSYGRGIELPGRRYGSLISAQNLSDVVITGENGTIDGQGSIWWEKFTSRSLNYSRPNLVEFISCVDVLVSNLTFLNPPSWSIHPVYCSYVHVENITVYAPPGSPYTSGVVPDSSEYVCIQNCNITTGHYAIALKSGWDEYGITFNKPTQNTHIKNTLLQSSLGSALAFGSEMSGGISTVLVEDIHIHDSLIAIGFKTTRGRGGYVTNILISDVKITNTGLAITATGFCNSHPDDKFDPKALPIVGDITINNMVGVNITLAGKFTGIKESPFTSICLSNITLSTTSWSISSFWICSNVMGFYENVVPKPCQNFQSQSVNSSSGCFSILNSGSYVI